VLSSNFFHRSTVYPPTHGLGGVMNHQKLHDDVEWFLDHSEEVLRSLRRVSSDTTKSSVSDTLIGYATSVLNLDAARLTERDKERMTSRLADIVSAVIPVMKADARRQDAVMRFSEHVFRNSTDKEDIRLVTQALEGASWIGEEPYKARVALLLNEAPRFPLRRRVSSALKNLLPGARRHTVLSL
jgi:hypothetical protein